MTKLKDFFKAYGLKKLLFDRYMNMTSRHMMRIMNYPPNMVNFVKNSVQQDSKSET